MSALTAAQQAEFRRACVDDGVDPKVTCPLCRGPVGQGLPRFSWSNDPPAFSKEPTADEFSCGPCGVSYVVRRPPSPAGPPPSDGEATCHLAGR